MVKKLIKYDFLAFAKVMLPIEIALVGIAALYRFVTIFESNTTAFKIFNVSTVTILVIAALTAFIMTFVYSFVRFYKNLYTAEGYLSFTLPVTPSAHIASKLTVSLIYDLITVVTAFVAFAVATAGEVFGESMKAAFYLYGKAAERIGGATPFYVIEFILTAIVAVAAAHLLTYMCVSLGQTAKRHKILSALGIYFAIYVVKQLLGTLYITTGVTTDLFDEIVSFAAKSPNLFVHLFFLTVCVVEAALGAEDFAVTGHVMKKKLKHE